MRQCLIVGGTGQLGTSIINKIKMDGLFFEYSPTSKEFDICKHECYYKLFDRYDDYRLIINAAAKTQVDLCEIQEYSALSVNALGLKYLA